MSFASLIPILSALLIAATAVIADTSTLDTASAKYRTLPREYRLDGIVEAVSRGTVSAQTQGQVQEILYDVNDFVEKDAVVARLKDTEHRARVAQAAAEIKAATATLEQSREDFERVEDLFSKKLVSVSAMDKATAELKSAEARFESANAGLKQAREQLAYTEVRAPYSGIVTRRHLEVGEMANPGQAVMSGISLEEMRVIVDVPQSVIPAVRQDRSARVYLPDGSMVEAAKITVFPFADLGSNTFKVRLDLPGRVKQVFPGMLVKTGFDTGEKRALVIPKSAVVYRSEVTGTYVVTQDRVGLRLVRLGRDLGDSLVVLAGLTEGEQVALDPIAAGAVLKAQATGTAKERRHD